MKFNFYITAENDEEAQACIDFIRTMTKKREGGVKIGTNNGDWPSAEDDAHKELSGKPVVISGLRPSPDGGLLVPRLNVSPGPSSISKIGENAKLTIMSELRTGDIQPHAKYAEHLKLLWARGEVKYDGKEYFI